MATLHTEFTKLSNNQEIEFSISFNKERTNWATSQPKKIGYELHAVPVNRTQGEGYQIKEFGAFTGFNKNLLEIDRQSAKRLQTAIGILQLEKQKFLDWFNVKYGLMTSEDYKKKYDIH